MQRKRSPRVHILWLLPVLMLFLLSATTAMAAGPNWNNDACYGSGNPFTSGYKYQCSWYAWGRARELTGVKMSSRMTQFVNSSVTGGYTTTPSTNSVAVYMNSSGYVLHVAFIESFDGKYVTYSEGNNSGLGTGPQKYYTTTMELSKFTTTTKKWVGSSCTVLKYVPLQKSTAAASTITVQTKPATNIGNTNATVNGHVTKAAGVTVTQCGVYLGTSILNMKKRNTEIPSSAANNKQGGFDIWYNLTDELKITLTPGTTYHYMIYAVCGGKEYWGKIASFTTTGHRHTWGPAATCTTAQTCTSCGQVLQSALGHSAGAAANCTTDQTCTRCGKVLQSALGHSAGAAASCTTDQTCTRCGVVLKARLGHSAGAAASCTTDQTCTRCGVVLKARLGHSAGAAASCTTNQTCTRCGIVLKAKLGHSAGAWKTVKKATKTASGKRVKKCTRCGATLASEKIPKIKSTKKLTSRKVGTVLRDKKTGLVYKVTKAGASGKATVELTGANSKASSVTIPDTVVASKVKYKVTSIAAKAFANNRKLKKIKIGKNISKIGSKAFYGCKNLKSITIGTIYLKTGNVGTKAFSGISRKATVKVPKKSLLKSYKKLLLKKGITKQAKFK